MIDDYLLIGSGFINHFNGICMSDAHFMACAPHTTHCLTFLTSFREMVSLNAQLLRLPITTPAAAAHVLLHHHGTPKPHPRLLCSLRANCFWLLVYLRTALRKVQFNLRFWDFRSARSQPGCVCAFHRRWWWPPRLFLLVSMLLWANSYLCALDHAGFRNLYHGTVLLRRRVQFDLGFRDFHIEEHTYLVCTFHRRWWWPARISPSFCGAQQWYIMR
jgi:hypothetical protein